MQQLSFCLIETEQCILDLVCKDCLSNMDLGIVDLCMQILVDNHCQIYTLVHIQWALSKVIFDERKLCLPTTSKSYSRCKNYGHRQIMVVDSDIVLDGFLQYIQHREHSHCIGKAGHIYDFGIYMPHQKHNHCLMCNQHQCIQLVDFLVNQKGNNIGIYVALLDTVHLCHMK